MSNSNNKSLISKCIDMVIVILTIIGFFKGALSMTLGLNITGVCLVLACLSWFLNKNAKDTDIATPIIKIFLCGILMTFSVGKSIPGNSILLIGMDLFFRTILIAFIILKWTANKIDNLMH